MTTSTTATTELIHRYLELAVLADREPYFAQFATDAVVEDEGREHHGIAAIRAWRTSVPSVTYTALAIEQTAADHVARVNISGDFPGSPVTLTFTFRFTEDDRIASLTIRP
jgi:hypothetical protein